MAAAATAAAAPAADDEGAARINRFATLPHAVTLKIFARVPLKARARCALVCPAWRDHVAAPSLWLQLDLTTDGDGDAAAAPPRRCTLATLHSAAARARGQLQTLRLACDYSGDDWSEALCAVAAANAASLSEVYILGTRWVTWRRCWTPRRRCACCSRTCCATAAWRHTTCCATWSRSGRCACAS
jgi:hypothetical protein